MKRIAEYITGYNFERFKNDNKTIDAVVRNLEIIGEASRNLDNRIKNKYQGIPWQEMYYLRNKVMHEYFGVDHEIIWDIITNYLPQNKIQIDRIIEQEV
jgi:uncharacterized protein with HEPN domain